MAERSLSARPVAAPSVLRYLGATGVALWALVLALRPDPGFAAPGVWMALFWALQIGAGLAVLQTVLFLMSRLPRFHRGPLWLMVLGSGIVGAAVLTPVYWLIGEGLMQTVLGFEATLDDDGDTGVLLPFGVPALLQEFAEIVGFLGAGVLAAPAGSVATAGAVATGGWGRNRSLCVTPAACRYCGDCKPRPERKARRIPVGITT